MLGFGIHVKEEEKAFMRMRKSGVRLISWKYLLAFVGTYYVNFLQFHTAVYTK